MTETTKTVFRANVPGSITGEGLVASVIDHSRLAVAVRLEGRARTIELDRGAATRLAVAILLGLQGRESLHG